MKNDRGIVKYCRFETNSLRDSDFIFLQQDALRTGNRQPNSKFLEL